MINTAKICAAIFLFAAGLCTAQGNSPWIFSNRIQYSLERDSNVQESLESPKNATANRLLFQTKIKRAGKKSNLVLGYHGGLALYNDFSSENKLINEASFSYSHKIHGKFLWGIKSFGRLKFFINNETDYAFGNVTPFLRININRQNSAEIGYLYEGLDYAKSVRYDFNSSSFYSRLTHRFPMGLALFLHYRFGTQQFDRLTNTLNLNLQDLTEQEDKVHLFSFGTDFLWGGFLFNASYNFEQNSSNSYGFEYNRHYVNFIFAKNIRSVLLRGYLTWQNKNYLDEFLPSWPTKLDTEREESNFIVLDASKDISSSITTLVRFAWYKNESPWASLYYEKLLVNVGLELRFPQP